MLLINAELGNGAVREPDLLRDGEQIVFTRAQISF
jgi:hypothetical protein